MRENLTLKKAMPLKNKAFICLLLASSIYGAKFYFEKAFTGSPRKPDIEMTSERYISEDFDDRSTLALALDDAKSVRDLAGQRVLVARAVDEDHPILSNLEVEVCSSGVYISGSSEPSAERILLHYTPFTYDGFTALNDLFRRTYEHSINPHNFGIFIDKTASVLNSRGIRFRPENSYEFKSDRSDYEFGLSLSPQRELGVDFKLCYRANQDLIKNTSQYQTGMITTQGGFTLVPDGEAFGSITEVWVDKDHAVVQPCPSKFTNSRDDNAFGSSIVDIMQRLIEGLQGNRGKYLSMGSIRLLPVGTYS